MDGEIRRRGSPVPRRAHPDEIQRLLGQLLAESTVSGDVLDIYDAAEMPKPTLTDLTPDFDPAGKFERHTAVLTGWQRTGTS
ncbi:MAG: type I restriction enzyme endonuclease domain-containing protein [Pseudonocardiaceae bacterium]